MKKTTIQVAKEAIEEIYTKFSDGKVNQGEAIAQIQSLVSVLERCVNKHNTPGNGLQDKNLQKKADKQFPHLKLFTLNLNPKVTGKHNGTLFAPPPAAYTDPKGDVGSPQG